MVGLIIFYFFKRENTENFKQNKWSQITAFRRERNYSNQKVIYFKLLAFLLGAGGVRKYHHYYFPAQVQDWLVRQWWFTTLSRTTSAPNQGKVQFFFFCTQAYISFFIILFHFYTEYSAKLSPEPFRSCNKAG